ncbi:hypothetical protein [Streptomyces sp. NBC_01363]|uniref:hypothetical protein n=1 Tax=Streptomyces sp. NBC_01363 TaxID=2903840 RepID=UPI002252AF1B|nr:hypothetical protein [Streptomyces sp. NBC_01363]MCX4735107.1 hypothetical protein [Streptomyces sp. NBC_01363]
MTELSTETEPVAGDTTTAPAPVAPRAESPAPATTPQPAKATVAHTPGGWPALPLAVTSANSAVSALAAAALAGGPVAAAVAATGACALGVAAASRTRRARTRAATHAATGATHRTGARAGGRSGVSRMSAGHASGATRKAGARTARGANRAGGKSGTGVSLGKQRSPHRTTGAHASPTTRHGSATPAKPRTGKAGSGGAGRIGQVKELRAAQRAAAPTRAAQRTQTTAARRAVADSRRAAKAAARTTPATTSGKSPSDRPGGPGGSGGVKRPGRLGRARAVVAAKARAMREKRRRRRDQRTEQAVEGKRAEVRKAPARRAARRALWRSAARFQQRRLLAALLAAPLGVLGLLTTPLGRRLGWSWLMHPGRRLYRHLLNRAQEEKSDRDAAIRARLEEEEAAAEAADEQDPNDIADRVERPAHLVPSTTPAVISGGENVSGFKFEEAATEMQAAAMLYEPDGCMEILAMVDGLPEALKMIAHVMQILAERSDSEFPLEKEVAAGFNDIYDLLIKAAAGAEELPDIFRRVHEQDIARHEDPRNGTEAEKGWNV